MWFGTMGMLEISSIYMWSRVVFEDRFMQKLTPWVACFDLIETVEILMNMLVPKMKFMCMKYLTAMGVCIGYYAKGWWVVSKGPWYSNWVVRKEQVWSRCMEHAKEAIMDTRRNKSRVDAWRMLRKL